ncbi:MAG: Nramp family divalent metal transporter [Prolixibacteraceae bacterium]|nr:Nramp family divalent metal transporter [Prolixibacteraceae bacterium]MBN2775831.1 Nramp family divalent metal transporter [Prolixibacteraceae bacterium]
MSAKSRILNILFWSVVSAAFIGPGTITTAAKSGAEFGTGLLWALLFSTLACLVLQEAAARLTIASGKNLGQAIAFQYEKKKSKLVVLILVMGAIVVGAAAYEMGNIIGAVAGTRLIFNLDAWTLVLIIAGLAAMVLSIPSLKIISTIMGIVVAIMGIIFLITSFMVEMPLAEIIKGAFIPSIPKKAGAGLLILGLIGTTIVPYNLFLGSGIIKKGQGIKEMQFGISIAIILGGIFSMAVLIVGTSVIGTFSFENLAETLVQKIGPAGKYMLGFGLFAAGFTSAVTAPLASAITIKSVFGNRNQKKWETNSWNFRLGWILVLIAGIIFAITNVKPIPAIILAQALNGFLLPFVSIFLFISINNKNLMRERLVNPLWLNVATILIIAITIVIGLNNAAKAMFNIFIPAQNPGNWLLIVIIILSVIISGGVWIKTMRKNKSGL